MENKRPGRSSSHSDARPLPLRAYTETEVPANDEDTDPNAGHWRRKSTHTRIGGLRVAINRRRSRKSSELSAVRESMEDARLKSPSLSSDHSDALTPPRTPLKESRRSNSGGEDSVPDITPFDFSKIDYELDRAHEIGTGLWSAVKLAQPITNSPHRPSSTESITPPVTPQRKASLPPCGLFAVKTPARADSKDVFLQEAKILTRLQRAPDAYHYVVPFHGLDSRNTSLVFEGVIGGSLEELWRRLSVMTELERHLKVRSLFLGLASDLIGGLHFIHAAGVVHADIKPANILLDVSEKDDFSSPVIRARYIDFSASFIPEVSSSANAGGTWDYMAPEQMRIQKDLNTPTFASDVWSLGITLLSIIVGGSPYTAACGDNAFRLREGIKSGDPIGFAKMDPVVHKRQAACQDLVDCCRLALQKDRERRITAEAWVEWLERKEFGL